MDGASEGPAPVHRRVRRPLVALGIVAVGGAVAGAYFGLHAARLPGPAAGGTPPPRAYAAMAYDEAAHQVVLFGGMGDAGAVLDDTWTWDGSAWTQQHPSVSPPARAFAGMTYDPDGRDLILVGGRQMQAAGGPIVCSGGVSGSVTATVPRLAPASPPNGALTPPPVSVPPPMSVPVTPASPRPCRAPAPQALDDTWTWDGGAWHRTNAALPAGIALSEPVQVATDPTTGQVLLLAQTQPEPVPLPACPVPAPGSTATPSTACAAPAMQAVVRAWTWSGTAWAQVVAALPAAGMGIAVGGTGTLVADPTSGHLADFRSGAAIVCDEAPSGGANVMPCPLKGSTGSGSGAPTVVPPAAPGAPAAVPAPQAPGTPPAANAPQTPRASPLPLPTPPATACCSGSVTVWDGSGWSQPRSLASSPTAFGSPIAGDAAHHGVIAYVLGATWRWDGSAWSQLHPARAPGLVSGTSIAYDGLAGRVLLFGGVQQGSPGPPPGYSNALWAWDGTAWTLLSGTTASPTTAATPSPTAAPLVPPSFTPRPSPS
jgi:hypothetical protein